MSERTASDVLNLNEFLRGKEIDIKLAAFINAKVISDGLSYWIGTHKTQWRLKRLFKPKNIMSKLSIQELEDLAAEVLLLEGIDVKKKMKEQIPSSADKSSPG